MRLAAPDGTAITADDLRVNHEHKLHVLTIDEGLDNFHHLHLDEDEDGVFQISFTPQHSRVYRVWVDTQLSEPLSEPEVHDDHENHDHDHGGDHDHEHGGHDHDHEGKETATAWIAVGEDAAPYIAPIEVLESEANGYRFTLAFDGHIHAGEPVLMRLSATDPDGNSVMNYDSYLGAFAHLVGFNRGASAMLHAHPTGNQITARDGRIFSFDVHIDEPGVHRLFAEMRIGGEKVVASFTVVAE